MATTHIMLCLLVYDGVQHICCADLCMMVSNTYYVVLICVWWCPTHIMLCLLVYGGVQHILCCAYLCMVVSNTYCVVLTCVWWCPTHIMLCFCFFFLRFLYAMFPVSLDCSFLIAPLCVTHIVSFLCCVLCFVCLRFVSYVACVSALLLLITFRFS
jgi:hypothetical protein